MKRIIAVGIFLILAAFSAAAQNLPSIVIVNNTGYEVWYIYVSPSEDDSWGSDVLGPEQTIPNGRTFTYRLPQPLSRVKSYDIMLEDRDGDTYSKYRISVANNSRIVFTFDDIDDDD